MSQPPASEDGVHAFGVLLPDNEGRVALGRHLSFRFDKAEVHPRVQRQIARVARRWRRHPDWARIVLEGHTDERGPDAYNQRLSEQRALRVKEELIRLGVPRHAIETRGFGESRPRDPGVHRRNRRVELKVMPKFLHRRPPPLFASVYQFFSCPPRPMRRPKPKLPRR
jgi:OOP family OmpA-OmpF porin